METTTVGRSRLVWAAAILALGMLGGALAFGLLLKSSRSVRSVQVTGAATRGFVSDIAKWRLSLSLPVAGNDLTQGYASLSRDIALLVERLRAAGVPDSAINLQPVSAQPQWNRDGERSGFIYAATTAHRVCSTAGTSCTSGVGYPFSVRR